MYTIYKITNNVNSKIYVGITSQPIQKRFNNHKAQSKRKNNIKFYHAIRKYGIQNFEIQKIDVANNLESACKKERQYISKYDSIKLGYNTAPGGLARGNHTEASKKKISLANTGNKRPDVTLLLKGKPSRQNFSDLTRLKMAISHTGKLNFNYGKKLPKISCLLCNAVVGGILNLIQHQNGIRCCKGQT